MKATYSCSIQKLVVFPNSANAKTARTVAIIVTVTTIIALANRVALAIHFTLSYGFITRSATGPRLSSIGNLAMHGDAPHLDTPRLTLDPPKRFVQSIGASFITVAVVIELAISWTAGALVLHRTTRKSSLCWRSYSFSTSCFPSLN